MKRWKMTARIISSLLVLQMAVGNTTFGDKAFAQTVSKTPKLQVITSPVNPAYTQYQKNVAAGKNITSKDGKALGYVPAPHKYVSQKVSQPKIKTDAALPSQFDLRNIDGNGKSVVTSVKDQGQIGDCWAFASCGAMESEILNQTGTTYDFSENNLETHNGFSFLQDEDSEGGNRDMSAAYFARWENKDGITGYKNVKCNGGPLLEEQDPYVYDSDYRDAYIQYRDTSSLKDAKHLTDALELQGKDITNPTDISELPEFKQALMTYGAIDTSIMATDDMASSEDGDYWSTQYNSLYFHTTDPNQMYSDHEVVIVGWDDNFSKDNFATPAPANGAWIVKNSWGSSWGNNGYFYMSYYDTMAGNEGTVYLTKDNNDGSNIYQYDDLGKVDQIAVGDPKATTVCFSNVFTPKAANEQLSATSFYTTEENEAYQVYVVDNVTGDLNTDVSGLQPIATGTTAYMGYHTVNFDTPVTLAGGKFAVIVKVTLKNPSSSNPPIAVEDVYPGYSDRAALTAKAGRGYVSADGKSWTDVTNLDTTATICLKAFTNTPVSSSLASGTYIGAQTVEILPNTNDISLIRYTLDGSDPTADVTVNKATHRYGAPIVLDGNGKETNITLKFMAVNYETGALSPIYTQHFTIEKPLANPTSYLRISGIDRYNTAVEISKQAYNQSNFVVLASGDDAHYSDALAATPLAKAYNAPILLTASNSLPVAVENEMIRLQAKNIIVVGGTGAVSDDIVTKLNNEGFSCTRLAGTDRYDTSVTVARYMLDRFGTSGKLFVASGNGFADAISIASYAASTGTPIILSDKDSISTSEQALLKDLSKYVSKCYVIGGTGVISDKVMSTITQLDPNCKITRLGGINRYDTNQIILNTFTKAVNQDDIVYNLDKVYFATGESFPDALSGAALAAISGSPILLVSPNEADNTATAAYIATNAGSINAKYVFGGTGAVSDDTLTQILTSK